MPWTRIPLQVRFWKHVKKVDDGCWEWTAAVVRGYGKIGGFSKVDDRKVQLHAHRVSWELAFGTIPDGLLVLHRCDNTKCVRPDHLFLGTHKDNVEDMHRKGRGSYGEDHWKHKLTSASVKEIRERFQNGETKRGLARVFGVDKSTIKAIVERVCWNRIDLDSQS